MESTLAGKEPALFSETSAAASTCTSISPEFTPVGGGVHLALAHRPDVPQGVPKGPVDLRHAAHAVGVLNLGAVRVRGHHLAVGQQALEVAGAGELPGVGADRLDARVEGPLGALR